jgi:hypothetical protein
MNDGKVQKMTTLRKWRFPILIGAGVLAAGILFYVSSNRVNPEKTQGAIGKRDVYRDGQVASADVDQAGSAPVAVKAVLESGEFKALAKNPAFQEVLRSDSFAQLAREQAFVRLLANGAFQNLARDNSFAALLQSSAFQGASAVSGGGGGPRLFAGLEQNSQFGAMARSEAFQQLTRDQAFLRLMHESAFVNLAASASFQSLMGNSSFARLASLNSFQSALVAGSSANLVRE